MWNLQKSESRKHRVEKWLLGAGGNGKMYKIQSTKLQLCKVLEI